MAAVVALHGAALYVIASSLGVVPTLIEAEPKAFVLEQPRELPPPEAPPEVIEPRLAQPPLTMPPPVVSTDAFPSENLISAEVMENPPEIPLVLPPAHQPQLVGVRQDARHPLSQPAYPPIDIRQGNEGSVELEVYVLPTGRVGDVRVLKSTGSPTLDQSAMDEARRRWRLLPATRDGEAYAQWHRLKVTFSLRNR
jgi:protein TonB